MNFKYRWGNGSSSIGQNDALSHNFDGDVRISSFNSMLAGILYLFHPASNRETGCKSD